MVIALVLILAGAAVAQSSSQGHGLAHGAQVAPLALKQAQSDAHALLCTGGIAVRGLSLLRLMTEAGQSLGALPVANSTGVELLQQWSGCPRGGQAGVGARGVHLGRWQCQELRPLTVIVEVLLVVRLRPLRLMGDGQRFADIAGRWSSARTAIRTQQEGRTSQGQLQGIHPALAGRLTGSSKDQVSGWQRLDHGTLTK